MLILIASLAASRSNASRIWCGCSHASSGYRLVRDQAPTVIFMVVRMAQHMFCDLNISRHDNGGSPEGNFRFGTRTSSLGAACPLPPSADIRDVGGLLT